MIEEQDLPNEALSQAVSQDAGEGKRRESNDVTSPLASSSSSDKSQKSVASLLKKSKTSVVPPPSLSSVVSNTSKATHRIIYTNRLIYSWSDINASTTLNSGMYFRFRDYIYHKGNNPGNTKQILKNGIAQAGQILAIMGPSGAGKTTLLNALTCRNTGKLLLTGERLINGVPVDKKSLASVSAYIQQSDLFVGVLTVREHLHFHATLRLDHSIPYQQRFERVEVVLREMGLDSVADTRIGTTEGIHHLYLSYGQKKRLSIATEILGDPGILFCDEPTTGLDSFMALSVMKSLKVLAAEGKTILCTIHQPASQVVSLFDKVLLLFEGRVAFIGNPNSALDFFANQGFPCPINYNPTDFFLITFAVRPGLEKECLEKSAKICDEFTETKAAQAVQEAVRMNRENSDEEIKNQFINAPQKYSAPWCTQLGACLWRSWKTILRDPIIFRLQLFQVLANAVIIGATFWKQQKMDQDTVQNIRGLTFMTISSVTLSGFLPVITVFWAEIKVFMRDNHNGVYRTDVYYLSKWISELPVYVILPTVFITIVYWMVDLYSGPKEFFFAVGTCILVTNVCTSMGILLSCVSSTLQGSLELVTPFIIPFAIFGGTFLHKESISKIFFPFKYTSWFLLGNEMLSVNQWRAVKNISCPPVKKNEDCYKSGEEVLISLDFREDNIYRIVYTLFAVLIGLRIAAFIGYWIKTRKEN